MMSSSMTYLKKEDAAQALRQTLSADIIFITDGSARYRYAARELAVSDRLLCRQRAWPSWQRDVACAECRRLRCAPEEMDAAPIFTA